MSNVVRSAAVRLTMENASYIRGANQAAAVTEQATGRMQRSVRGAAASTGRDWDTMGKYGGRYAVAVGAGLAIAEKRILSFDKTMSAAQAATRAQGKEFDALRAAAIKAGADTAFTSTEAAQAITEEGKAGISTANILSGGLKGALDLAAAGTIAVGDAAEYTATTLTQFHLGGDQARHVADLLAASAGKAQGEVGDMSLALSYVGVPAHAARISLEETVGTIALLAKNGLVGEKAGTSLRGMLASLERPSHQAQKAMDALGLSFYDTKGQFIGFDGVARVLHTRLGGLTDQQRQYALGTIFGNEQMQAATILYDAGAKGVRKWTKEVNDQGYATDTANQKLNNLAGDWERFTGTLESAFIKAGSPAQAGLRDMVQNADDLVHAFQGLPDEVQQGIVKVAVLTSGIGAAFFAISKIRNVARDLRGGGVRGGGATGLGRAASLAAPVPVFVTNLGAGSLAGAGGKGGTTVLGGGTGGGKVKGFALPRGTGLALTAGGLALMALGVTDKTHTGSTVTGGIVGGQLGGPLGAAVGGTLGAGLDVLHAGDSTKSALGRALDALDSNDIKEQRAALVGLRTEIDKLQNGGKGQNFNRFVTAVSGRAGDLLAVEDALSGLVETDKKADLKNLRFLLDPNYKGGRPAGPDIVADVAKGLESLLTPDRKGGTKKPKPKTSEDVLAELYGIDTRKLKPIDLLSDITGIAGVFGTPGKSRGGGGGKNPVAQLSASLGLDTDGFDKKARGVKQAAAGLDRLTIAPTVTAKTGPAIAALGKFEAYLRDVTRPRTVDVHVRTGKAGGVGDLLGQPITPADGATVPGARGVYGDRVPALLAPTEEVISNRYGQADRWRPFLKAINANRLADGGTVGGPAGLSTYSRSHPNETPRHELNRFKTALEKATKALDEETRQRDELVSKRDQIAATVSGRFTTDIFDQKPSNLAYMSEADRQRALTQGPVDQLRADTANALQFQKLLDTVATNGLTDGAFQALAETGDIQRAQAFANLSRADLAQYQSAFEQRANAVSAVGSFAGNTVYAPQIDESNKQLVSMNKQIADLNKEIKHLQNVIEHSSHDNAKKVGDAVVQGKTVQAQKLHHRRR